ncbi:uncharacterized protein LOC119598084 [Penaeus monodon]|uniref:uncharacterized protein LOC119598084 n=1 Tax=Penaeus monodon TaxID=6687 RepID=UPI0018A7BCCC|nr:uncharacterized protein LOC119598084 [Penaeus monodon]
MTYGSKTWTTTKIQERKLASAQRRMERLVLGISLRDKRRATWIRKQTKVETIVRIIKKKEWPWAGLIRRRQDECWTKKVIDRDIINTRRPDIRSEWRDELAELRGNRTGNRECKIGMKKTTTLG